MISRVLPDSIAEELGLEPGDRLVSVNGQPVEDVFDYRYLMNEELVVLLVEKPDGEEWELEVEKEYEEDLGIEFENGGLMDDYRSCSNKCMFCFIDQMPPGMRPTLYFKDDDSRLSFLQGNYVTLTNMSQDELFDMFLSVFKYDIKDQQGFPWDQKELRYYGTYYGFPTTLKENAIRAHKYLFGTSDYQVSDELSRINQKIIYRAGY